MDNPPPVGFSSQNRKRRSALAQPDSAKHITAKRDLDKKKG